MRKIATLIITAFILYSLLDKRLAHTFMEKTGDVKSSTQNTTQEAISISDPQIGNFFEKTLSNVLINVLHTEEGRLFFENIVQPMNKPIAEFEGLKVNNNDMLNSIFKIRDRGNISDKIASCGHLATVFYKITDMSGNVVESESKTWTLGSMPTIPALDTLVTGMSVGQTREAIIPPKYAYYNEKYKTLNRVGQYKVEATLSSLLPEHFIDSKVRVFDDLIAYKMPIMCGDQVSFHAKITRLSDSEVIYDSKSKGKKIVIRVGDPHYPMIFSYALTGKIPVGSRTVIAPGSNYSSFATGSSIIFPEKPLNSLEYFMTEISDIDQL
jgi:hypothetical protein